MSLVDFKDEWWTVRPWGADSPPANFKVVPETMFVSGGVELLTADGPVFEQRTVRDFAEKSVTANF